MQQHRDSDVVGQVRHQRGRIGAGDGIDVEGVGEDDLQPVGSLGHPLGHRVGKLGGQHLVDLDSDDLGAGLKQAEGQ